jgi:prepilin-type N-terminal cleavage/methylation domain-containing protein
MSRGFTLLELLVVILIIGLVSVVALPVVLPAVSHRQVSEAARIVQGALAGARDSAIHSSNPAGIRLLPDPTFSGVDPTYNALNMLLPLACNRIVPLEPAPAYSEGMVSVIQDTVTPFPATLGYPWTLYPATTNSVTRATVSVLMVEQCPINPTTGLPNGPTSWFWNIRVGERISIGNSGQVYTVVGPLALGPAQGNTDLFVNDGSPGATPQLARTYQWTSAGQAMQQTFSVEYLFLVNGQDDDLDGYVDDGWDGVDNNLINGIDEPAEWTEAETWLGSLASLPSVAANVPSATNATGLLNQAYSITRRPVPSSKGREISLPTNVVIDLTTWGNAALGIGPPERSRVPSSAFNTYTGVIDILVYPNGVMVPTTIYSSPSSVGLSGSFIHLWLAERQDVVPPAGSAPPTLPVGTIAPGLTPPFYSGPAIKGEYRLISLFARTGQTTTNDVVYFDNPTAPQSGTYNPNYPYLQIQQGAIGGQ